MYDPLWLRSFVTVSETLNFTAAAARLGLRQPTVSEHVRKLETLCGRRLFTRDTRSVTLTADGEAMLGFATAILETAARARRHFARDDIRGRIRLGVSEDVVLRGLPQALRRFTAEHPRMELELTVGLSEAMREQLDHGALDLVFLKRRVGDTHGEMVWREPLVWIAAPDFRLDPDRPLPLILLAPPSLTRSLALAALEKFGRRWQRACSSASQSGIHAAVFAGLGIAPHARSLAPFGSAEIQHAALPDLGEIEFAVIGGRASKSGPAKELATMIKTSGVLLRTTLPPQGDGRLGPI